MFVTKLRLNGRAMPRYERTPFSFLLPPKFSTPSAGIRLMEGQGLASRPAAWRTCSFHLKLSIQQTSDFVRTDRASGFLSKNRKKKGYPSSRPLSLRQVCHRFHSLRFQSVPESSARRARLIRRNDCRVLDFLFDAIWNASPNWLFSHVPIFVR